MEYAAAQELVVKLERNELDIINGNFYPVEESMKKLIEGKHKDGCQCGFCKNKGKFGRKTDTAETGSDDSKKPTAESIVRRLLDT